jgi:hypothetical protein
MAQEVDLIISHAHCPDGWTAAYIAKKKYPEATVMFRDHGLEPPYAEVTGKNVLVLDFSWRTREQNDKMASLAKTFQILDHHKSAQAVLEGAEYAVFDMKRSGAGLAWDYLFGVNSTPLYYKDRPWYVAYVEDRDLWNWALPNTHEICAYLGTLEFTKEAWDKVEFIDWTKLLAMGAGALAHINHYVREAVLQAQEGHFLNRKLAVLNVPYLNCSDVGNALAKTHEVSLTWFERGDGQTQFSLRSIGDIDVSEIAKIFNGGGHKNAAGFSLDLTHGRALIDSLLERNNYKPFIQAVAA